uniref:Uncharacterized protein n=1 Tax=Rhizophora mucronata TaxID=61149 RepID=A0A2P2PR68_RHIMU
MPFQHHVKNTTSNHSYLPLKVVFMCINNWYRKVLVI